MAKGLRRNRNVKIVATLGPSSSTEEMVSRLFEEGVDVFRLNLSHGLHDEIKKRHEIIRKVENKFRRPICILADLQGPKLRCGDFKDKQAELVTGQTFVFDKERALGNSKRVYLPEFEVFKSLKKDSKVLVNDGKIKLVVKEVSENFVSTEVLVGGIISDKKGINVPDQLLPL